MEYVEYVAESLGDIGKRRTSAGNRRYENLDVSRDTGCEDFSPSCLTCPLPKCIIEYPAEQRGKIRRRFREWKLRQQQSSPPAQREKSAAPAR